MMSEVIAIIFVLSMEGKMVEPPIYVPQVMVLEKCREVVKERVDAMQPKYDQPVRVHGRCVDVKLSAQQGLVL